MIKQALSDILNGKHLSLEDTKSVMLEIMEGSVTPAQAAAFLTAMRLKGETIDEITACAMVMRQMCLRLTPKTDVLDIVGTGGDELFTFNISTVSAFVVASGGVPVAKHGNRSVSSKCGSADVLEALGANINLSAAQSEKILEQTGICFMLAQTHHSSMKHIAPIRKELGVRTIFNILGPLSNPAGATMQLLGVYDEKLVEPLANVLLKLGVKRAVVVHGRDGLDEITLTAPTTVCEISNGKLNSYFITPEQFGFKRCDPKDLTGGDPECNAKIACDILSGTERGPKRDIVLLNSALCLYMANNNITMKESVAKAAQLIDEGHALLTLNRFIECTNRIFYEHT